MSSIAVALALTVVLVGASLFIGGAISEKVVTRGNAIATSLDGANVNGATGSVVVTTP